MSRTKTFLLAQFAEAARLFVSSVWESAPLVQPMPGIIYRDGNTSIELVVPPKAYQFDSPNLLVCHDGWAYPVLADGHSTSLSILSNAPAAAIESAMKSVLAAKQRWSDKFHRHLRWQARYADTLLETINKLALSMKEEQVIANLLHPDAPQTPAPPDRLTYSNIIHYATHWLVASLNYLAIASGCPVTLYSGGVYLCADTGCSKSGGSVFAAVGRSPEDPFYCTKLFGFSASTGGRLVYIGQLRSTQLVSALFLRRASRMIEALSTVAERRFACHPVSGDPHLISMTPEDIERILINQ